MGKIFRKLTSSSSDSWLIQGMLQIDHLGADVSGHQMLLQWKDKPIAPGHLMGDACAKTRNLPKIP